MRAYQLQKLTTIACLIVALAASACSASSPTQTSSLAASATVRDSNDAMVGDWLLAIAAELELPTRMLLHISKTADGGLKVTSDDLTTPEKDEALGGVVVQQTSVSIDFDGATLSGTLDTDHNLIKGSLRPEGMMTRFLVHAMSDRWDFPMVMARVDPANPPVRLKSNDYTIDGHHIHYIEAAGSSAVRIVFIHGSPGTANNWNPYLTDSALQQRATLIAVDRPGFGKSDPGHVISDLREQARLLEPLLHEAPADIDPAATRNAAAVPEKSIPTVLVGWSEGGPIVAEMAMDYPHEVQAAVLEAPAIDPAHDGAQWYNHAVAFWPIGKLTSALMGDDILVTNQEIMALGPQLKTMETRWSSLHVPLAVVQGDADGLVDPRTADFAARALPQGTRVVRVPGAGHGVPFTKAAMDVLNEMLDLQGGKSIVAR